MCGISINRGLVPFGALAMLALVVGGCGGEERVGALGAEGAHEHGVARVNVAVDGNAAEVEFRSPAIGVYGFEHAPRTEEERYRQEEGLALLRTRASDFLVFDEGLGCTLTPVRVAIDEEDDHHGQHHDERHGEGEATPHIHEHGNEQGHGHGHGHGEHDRGQHEGSDATHGSGRAGQEEHGHRHDQEAAAQDAPDEAHVHEHDDVHEDEHGTHVHSEVHAEYRVTCAAPLAGTRLRFEMPSVFPGIDRLDIQVISESGQTGGRIAAASGITL